MSRAARKTRGEGTLWQTVEESEASSARSSRPREGIMLNGRLSSVYRKRETFSQLSLPIFLLLESKRILNQRCAGSWLADRNEWPYTVIRRFLSRARRYDITGQKWSSSNKLIICFRLFCSTQIYWKLRKYCNFGREKFSTLRGASTKYRNVFSIFFEMQFWTFKEMFFISWILESCLVKRVERNWRNEHREVFSFLSLL